MAAETGVENFVRRELRKRDDRRFAALRLDVGFAWAVTAFATRAFRRLFARCDAFEMRILVKAGPYVGMAGTAGVTADKARPGIGGGRRRGLLGQAKEWCAE